MILAVRLVMCNIINTLFHPIADKLEKMTLHRSRYMGSNLKRKKLTILGSANPVKFFDAITSFNFIRPEILCTSILYFYKIQQVSLLIRKI
jgi:hypothetical protein